MAIAVPAVPVVTALKSGTFCSIVVAATTYNGRNVINAMEKLELLKLPCIGHTLQLAVKHAFDVSAVSQVLAHIKRLVLHFRKSPKATYKLYDKLCLVYSRNHSRMNV